MTGAHEGEGEWSLESDMQRRGEGKASSCYGESNNLICLLRYDLAIWT
jgi:hypothetical protein